MSQYFIKPAHPNGPNSAQQEGKMSEDTATLNEETGVHSEVAETEQQRRFGPFTSIVSLVAIVALFVVMWSVLY
jgi:hypothetical protein